MATFVRHYELRLPGCLPTSDYSVRLCLTFDEAPIDVLGQLVTIRELTLRLSHLGSSFRGEFPFQVQIPQDMI